MYLYLIISNDVMMLCSEIRVNRRSREDITVRDYTLLLTDRYTRVCFISLHVYGDRTDKLCTLFTIDYTDIPVYMNPTFLA